MQTTERKIGVLILSHGRADRVVTYTNLRKCGYTGPIYLVVDNEDDQVDAYRREFGDDNVIVFDKAGAAEYTDTADTQPERNVVVFARNTCHKIAKDLGLTHFIEVDDDYDNFLYRVEVDGKLRGTRITQFDTIFGWMFDFLDVSGAVAVAPAQGGDYVGGTNGTIWQAGITRRAMNMFFCRTDRPFQFYGRLNEDTTAYTYLGQQGELFFTIADWCLHQLATQSNAGGLTDAYLELGTYVKSFYSVMYSPSCVRISSMASGRKDIRHERIHHRVSWSKCTPMILNEKWKKK